MPKDIREPSEDHPITLEKEPSRIVARVGTNVIAETQSALVLREASYPAVHYIPLEDVDQSKLRRTETTTYCPYKGDASYYTVVLPEGELTDVIWTYEAPYPAVDAISGHVAFYTDRVEVDAPD
jgi:uncharacterized protein (DUF427 family)